jgi:deazaflavin-dependent oxidoreductase (nitroreductase family)
MHATTTTSDHYLAPARADLVFNRVAGWLTRRGVGVAGSRELRVVGRRSGEVRTTVVNLLEVDGQRYLVAPRGHTQWVRNLRAAGRGELRVGRRVEAFTAHELPDDDHKITVLRAYLARWAWEVGRFFEGIDADSSDDELRAASSAFPAFRVDPT